MSGDMSKWFLSPPVLLVTWTRNQHTPYLRFKISHHGNLLSPTIVGNFDAASAVGAVVPDGFGDAGRASNGGGEDIVNKRASALLPASLLTTALTVPSSFALVQGSLKESGVGTGSRSSNCKRCKHQSGGQRSVGGRREEHLSKSDCS